MTTENPITPPPELVQQWLADGHHQDYCTATEHAIAQAARWGADQELEACCEWLYKYQYDKAVVLLLAARRPKPPTLKEQALAELNRLIALIPTEGALAMAEPIRRALEAMPND